MHKKISLIGAGNIGGTLAHLALLRNVGDVVLLDKLEGMPQGKALDLLQTMPVDHLSGTIVGTNDYSMISGSDVVIVTAGIARKPGMSRDDLIDTNSRIIGEVGKAIAEYAPSAFVIVITNPLDVMTLVMKKATGFRAHQVVGMAGVLDAARFRAFIADELKVASADVQTIVLGGHGDLMVPLIRFTSVGGVPLSEIIAKGLISDKTVANMIDRTRNGGGEIVGLLKTGSAYYAPASSAMSMAESYLFNRRNVVSATAYLQGEYGLRDIYVGVPVIIGEKGVEKIIELPLNDEEKRQFNASVLAVRDLTKKL